MPGDEVWLVGERRSTGEQKYYVSNLPADATIMMLAAAIKARWICEQAHQQMKEELGLDHFEGRSWTGLHRHALMTMIAYAFLQSRRLKAAGRKKNNRRTATTAEHARHQASHPRPFRAASTLTVKCSLQESPNQKCQSSASRFSLYRYNREGIRKTGKSIASSPPRQTWLVQIARSPECAMDQTLGFALLASGRLCPIPA